MNVLITNSHEFQAYLIACCLRREADRIVITEGGESVVTTGFRGMLPYSRFVDASHRVPPFADDWLAGHLSRENTKSEEAYIQRIEQICASERIDAVFPSLDPEVYLFAKNKERFGKQGILAVVPESDVLRVPLDKALTIKAAERAGFPYANTYFPANQGDVERIANEGRPPWMVKPRFTAHGLGMQYVANGAELKAAFAGWNESQPYPIVQDYIPGGELRMYNVMIGHDSEIVSLLSPVSLRAFRLGYRVSHRTTLSSSSGPFLPQLRALIRDLRLWGAYTFQTKIDPSDGQPKLLEINARFGNNMWRRTQLDVNEPLIFLRLAQGRPPTGNLTFPEGVLQLDPVNDLIFLCQQFVGSVPGAASVLRSRESRRSPDWTAVNPEGFFRTLGVYRHEYLNVRRKVFKTDFANLFLDPWPCIRSFCHLFGREVAIRLRRLRPGMPC